MKREVSINRIITQLQSSADKEMASVYVEIDSQEDSIQIEANREGLLLFAAYLLEASEDMYFDKGYIRDIEKERGQKLNHAPHWLLNSQIEISEQEGPEAGKNEGGTKGMLILIFTLMLIALCLIAYWYIKM